MQIQLSMNSSIQIVQVFRIVPVWMIHLGHTRVGLRVHNLRLQFPAEIHWPHGPIPVGQICHFQCRPMATTTTTTITHINPILTLSKSCDILIYYWIRPYNPSVHIVDHFISNVFISFLRIRLKSLRKRKLLRQVICNGPWVSAPLGDQSSQIQFDHHIIGSKAFTMKPRVMKTNIILIVLSKSPFGEQKKMPPRNKKKEAPRFVSPD